MTLEFACNLVVYMNRVSEGYVRSIEHGFFEMGGSDLFWVYDSNDKSTG